MGLFGIALVVRGAWGGVWPVSVQLSPALGLAFATAVARWRLLHR